MAKYTCGIDLLNFDCGNNVLDVELLSEDIEAGSNEAAIKEYIRRFRNTKIFLNNPNNFRFFSCER